MLRPMIALLAASTLLTAAAYADDSAPPASIAAPNTAADAPPAALSAPLKGGLTIVKKMPGNPGGLTPYLLKDEANTYYTFWVTADGNYMMAGALINAAGDNLTQQFQDKYEPKTDLSALWPKLEKAPHISTGTLKAPKKVIYAFVDPNCPYCHLLWSAARPYEEAGLEIHWIETGFLHEDSLGKAAAIITSTDPATTLNDSQSNFSANAGIKPLAEVPGAAKDTLKANLTLMHSFGFKGVPGIVYKDTDGTIHTKDGMPKLSDLAAISGSPVLPETDPQLERFK